MNFSGKIISPRVSFEIIEEVGVGEGAHSKVYRAKDSFLDGEIAVKVISIKDVNRKDLDNAINTFVMKNLAFEAKAQFENAHPHVLPIMYVAVDDNMENLFIVMKYMKNGSLKRRIQDTPLPLQTAINYVNQILQALDFIHNNKYLHLDIKPSNILLHDNGKDIYLSDFGQSELMTDLGVAFVKKGIYNKHFPPEYLDEENKGAVGIVSDIYQVGLTMYRFVNSDKVFLEQLVPFEKELSQIVSNLKNVQEINQVEINRVWFNFWKDVIKRGIFPNRKMYLPHVHYKIRKIINKALEVNPQNRYQTAMDMRRAFTNTLKNIDEPFWEPDSFDWENEIFIWKRKNGNSEEHIILGKNKSKYFIEAKRISKSKRVTKIKKCDGRHFPNLKDAFNFLEDCMYN